ncbi:MAG TPA: enoyl-CoA hydratase-related protein, partial [Burkholderiaceae bacterium]|nr:enoyl-CoA hydratase-related protein [Burkholderiaceae bacterium]
MNTAIVVSGPCLGEQEWLALEDLAHACGTPVDVVRELVAEGLLTPVGPERFGGEELARMRRIRRLHCPLVTAVNGPAAGAGMSFALLGDMVLCARSAYFLQAFRRIGLVPDCGSTWLLPRLIGRARAIELSLMGERLPAEKALEWGLVNRVYDDAALMDEAMKLAHELANGPTVALSLIRKLYWDSPENSFEEQLNLEFESQRVAGAAEDFREGVTAFL